MEKNSIRLDLDVDDLTLDDIAQGVAESQFIPSTQNEACKKIKLARKIVDPMDKTYIHQKFKYSFKDMTNFQIIDGHYFPQNYDVRDYNLCVGIASIFGIGAEFNPTHKCLAPAKITLAYFSNNIFTLCLASSNYAMAIIIFSANNRRVIYSSVIANGLYSICVYAREQNGRIMILNDTYHGAQIMREVISVDLYNSTPITHTRTLVDFTIVGYYDVMEYIPTWAFLARGVGRLNTILYVCSYYNGAEGRFTFGHNARTIPVRFKLPNSAHDGADVPGYWNPNYHPRLISNTYPIPLPKVVQSKCVEFAIIEHDAIILIMQNDDTHKITIYAKGMISSGNLSTGGKLVRFTSTHTLQYMGNSTIACVYPSSPAKTAELYSFKYLIDVIKFSAFSRTLRQHPHDTYFRFVLKN